MIRALLTLPLLMACGSIGLAPEYTEGVLVSEAESMADDLTGRTYAAWLSDVVAVEPMGLGVALADVDAAALLFHVTEADASGMSMVLALSDAEGGQNDCEPVATLPSAGWGDGMAFNIDEGSFDLPVGGKPMTLSELAMTGEIVNDGAEMAATTLFAEIDTRDLNGGVFGDDVDVCIIVEQLGSTCHACPDGEEACTELILELSPVEIDLDFDPTVSGC
ncbi:MAG: hypothetical protein ACI8RZ_006830 [Myxococcota bacterium]|jgi:hypothetical protein